MRLRQRQSIFVRNVAKLVEWIFVQGYEVTLGEAHRPEWVAAEYAKQGKGSVKSLHIQRLAIDLMLFKDGKYLDKTEDHEPVGVYWKSLHPDNRWGGDIKRLPDGNHYSMIERLGSNRI